MLSSRYTFTTVAAHSDYVTALDALGARLLSTSADHTACVYELTGAAPPRRLHVLPHAEALCAGALSTRWAATGGRGGALTSWELESGALARRFEGHTKAVVFVTWWGDTLLSASQDGTVKRWDADTGACVATLTGFTGGPACFSPAQGALYFEDADEVVALDLTTGARRRFPPDGRDQLLAFGLRGQRLVASYAEVSNSPSQPFRYNRAFDTRTGELIADPLGPADRFCCSSDGQRALTIRWDPDSVVLVDEDQVTEHLDTVLGAVPRCAAFTPAGALVLGNADGTLVFGVRRATS